MNLSVYIYFINKVGDSIAIIKGVFGVPPDPYIMSHILLKGCVFALASAHVARPMSGASFSSSKTLLPTFQCNASGEGKTSKSFSSSHLNHLTHFGFFCPIFFYFFLSSFRFQSMKDPPVAFLGPGFVFLLGKRE